MKERDSDGSFWVVILIIFLVIAYHGCDTYIGDTHIYINEIIK